MGLSGIRQYAGQGLGAGRLLELDGLRALLAWWVVAGHLALMVSDRAGGAIHNDSAVLVFMILSGFVISRLIADQRERYAVFITRRIFRLWPAYLVALGLSVLTLGLQRRGLVAAPFHPAAAAMRIGLLDAAMAHLGPNLMAHLVLAQGLVPQALLPQAGLTLLGVAWSLSVEFQFYLIAPLILALVRRGPAGIALSLGIAGLLRLAGSQGPLASNTAFIGHYVVWFAIGVGGDFLLRWDRPGRRAMVAGVFGAGLVALALWKHEAAALLWAGAMAVLMRPGLINRILRHPVLVRLGEASYSTYVCHMLAIVLGAAALDQTGLTGAPFMVALTAVTVIGTLVASLMLHAHVEKPAIRLGAKIARRIAQRQARRRDARALRLGAAAVRPHAS